MRSPTRLTWWRRYRVGGAYLFVLLLALVAGERRLADAHFNLRAWAIGFESADALDGDEIRVRLIALNDDQPPSSPVAGSVRLADAVRGNTPRLDRIPLGRPAPRGPPPSAASAA